MAAAPLLRQVSTLHNNRHTEGHRADPPQHILPLAGLTTALALYPKRSVYAEEPSSDPIAVIVRSKVHRSTLSTPLTRPPAPETHLRLSNPNTLPPRNLLHNTNPSIRHNLHPARKHPLLHIAIPHRPPGNSNPKKPRLPARLRSENRRRRQRRDGPRHARRAQLHLHHRLPRAAERE